MKQTTFSDAGFTHKKKQTRRDRFLAEIGAVTSWPALVAVLLPYYPKGEGCARPPVVWSGCCACTLRSSALLCRTRESHFSRISDYLAIEDDKPFRHKRVAGRAWFLGRLLDSAGMLGPRRAQFVGRGPGTTQ
jgi:hypothetical protein